MCGSDSATVMPVDAPRAFGIRRPAWWIMSLLAVSLAAVLGCASADPDPDRVGVVAGEARIDSEAVLERDLPPAEEPPVEIRSRTERHSDTGEYSYIYTVSNGTPYRITDVHIGVNLKDHSGTLGAPPLGLTEDGRMPASHYSAPQGWTLLYDRGKKRMGSMTWTAQDSDAILPGESLTGFRVSVARRHKEYATSGWWAVVTGEPGTYQGMLQPAGAGVPSGDPVERLGRLSISPRVARGEVTIRYRTDKKARPLVAIVDAGGEVVRRFPQDRRPLRERHLVWDRRDAAGREAPPGEYFVRVRYGFTERYGRVTLVR